VGGIRASTIRGGGRRPRLHIWLWAGGGKGQEHDEAGGCGGCGGSLWEEDAFCRLARSTSPWYIPPRHFPVDRTFFFTTNINILAATSCENPD
jgi:hypothetical protein